MVSLLRGVPGRSIHSQKSSSSFLRFRVMVRLSSPVKIASRAILGRHLPFSFDSCAIASRTSFIVGVGMSACSTRSTQSFSTCLLIPHLSGMAETSTTGNAETNNYGSVGESLLQSRLPVEIPALWRSNPCIEHTSLQSLFSWLPCRWLEVRKSGLQGCDFSSKLTSESWVFLDQKRSQSFL